eukprot:5418398-Prymnesium_polylepis.1
MHADRARADARQARARPGGKWAGNHLDVCVFVVCSPDIPEEVTANDLVVLGNGHSDKRSAIA